MPFVYPFGISPSPKDFSENSTYNTTYSIMGYSINGKGTTDSMENIGIIEIMGRAFTQIHRT